MNPIYINDLVKQALLEDLGHGRDITSALTLSDSIQAKAQLNAREDGILVGLPFAVEAFSQIDKTLKIETFIRDGAPLSKGSKVATISGHARSIMTAERVALNFLTHLSGIATLTDRFVDQVKDTQARICDTRKTLPLLRQAQKYAVRMGGGHNHRFGLDDAVLIKDNHIAACGGITEALESVASQAGHTLKIEIEVDTLEQLAQVLEHKASAPRGADIIMLDNMNTDILKTAVKTVRERFGHTIVLEASGGVNLKTVGAIAKTGVDIISVGALTHSASSLDIGLDIKIGK